MARLNPFTGSHQLQVVNDNHLQIVLLLKATALSANFSQCHIGRIIDEQRRVIDLAHGVGQRGPVTALIIELPLTQLLQRNTRFG